MLQRPKVVTLLRVPFSLLDLVNRSRVHCRVVSVQRIAC